ncbi:hypothetical protein J2X66_005826 [Pseudomonas sp. 3296]|jgi:hypothetical protein|nr:hypothetical protein [Pseudomonas sp. 3296]
MQNSDLPPSLLFKTNKNQLVLEASIMELSNLVEARGSADVADNVRSALDTIDRNEEFIELTLADCQAKIGFSQQLATVTAVQLQAAGIGRSDNDQCAISQVV